MLEQGTAAPDLDLPAQDGKDVKLSTLKARRSSWVSIPRPSPLGRTTQACGIRDHLPDGTAAGVRVLGVSPDPAKAVKTFHDKQALNFTLLADEDHAILRRLRRLGEKQRYGKTYMGPQRVTSIIDGLGTIATRHPEGLAEDATTTRFQVLGKPLPPELAQRGSGSAAPSEGERAHPLTSARRSTRDGP